MKVLGGNTIFVGSFPRERVYIASFPVRTGRRWKATLPTVRVRGDGGVADIIIRWEPILFYLGFHYSKLLPELWKAVRRAYTPEGVLRDPTPLREFGEIRPGGGEIFRPQDYVGPSGDPPGNYFYDEDWKGFCFPEKLQPRFWRPAITVTYTDSPRYCDPLQGYVTMGFIQNAYHSGRGSWWALSQGCDLKLEDFPAPGSSPVELWKTEGAWRWESWSSTSAGRWRDVAYVEVVSLPTELCRWKIRGVTGLRGSHPKEWEKEA